MIRNSRVISVMIFILISSIFINATPVSHTTDEISIGSFGNGVFNFANPSGDEIALLDVGPQIYFRDDTPNEDDFWFHINNNNSYVLADRDGDGNWEMPHPLMLEADTNTVYVFGNNILTSADEGIGNGLDADTLDNKDVWTPGNTNGGIVKLESGYVEIARYIDFHHDLTTTDDYDTRLDTSGSSSPYTGGDLFINNNMVWNEFNILQYKNLPVTIDADTLDGFHASEFIKDLTSSKIINCQNSDCYLSITAIKYLPIDYANLTFTEGSEKSVVSSDEVTEDLVIIAGSGGVRLYETYTYWSSNSDIRLKQNITVIENPLEKLEFLNGVYYHWRDENSSKERQVGVIAQDVEKVLPEIVSEAEGYKGVTYDGLIPLLIEAIKELKNEKDTEIELLNSKVELIDSVENKIEQDQNLLKQVLCEEFPEKTICQN